MAEIVVSLSSDKGDREIDKYHDESNSSDSSSSDSSISSDTNSTDEQYSSGILKVPLEVLQEEMRRTAASGLHASSSTSA